MFLEKMAEAVRFQTHNWNILGSNPAALTISFLKDPNQGITKINTQFVFLWYAYDVIDIHTVFIGMQLIYYANYLSPKRIRFRSIDCLTFIRMGAIWQLHGRVHFSIWQPERYSSIYRFVPGGKDLTSGDCSLDQTITI